MKHLIHTINIKYVSDENFVEMKRKKIHKTIKLIKCCMRMCLDKKKSQRMQNIFNFHMKIKVVSCLAVRYVTYKKINKIDSKMEIKGIQRVKERKVKKIQSRLCTELEIIQYYVFLPYWLIM